MRVDVGRYRVVGEEGRWQVMEGFGAYRISKKQFKTLEAATKRAKRLNGETMP